MNLLAKHQREAIKKLAPGSILCGGVGTGKSRTAIGYFKTLERRELYIITTAKKRDSGDWEDECSLFGVEATVDSWNNIKKYVKVKDAFFIFDEQRIVGKGAWVNVFLKIAKRNKWILLSATPGDTWTDYIPVFVANGFYKNRTEFSKEHCIYNRFVSYPLIERYIGEGKLHRLRNQITVIMHYKRHTTRIEEQIFVDYDKELYSKILDHRWDIYEDKPIKTISGVCYLLQKLVNSDQSRIEALKDLLTKNARVIIFYNFDYELEILRAVAKELRIEHAEWNGHKHEEPPQTFRWMYLVQYMAGSEGWNCIVTDTIIFYSMNYSYRMTTQAAGRIDRLNTGFEKLYYYTLRSKSSIDAGIAKALSRKKNFNIRGFLKK